MTFRMHSKGWTLVSTLVVVAASCGGLTSVGCESSDADVESEDDDLATANAPPIETEQGWSAATRANFHHKSQGSELMPAAWFAALEESGSTRRLPDSLEKFGFLRSNAPASVNPHGLPIGFAEARNDETAALYGDSMWVGLTCAACHTSELTLQRKTVRIEGGPPMIDFTGFTLAVLASVKATLKDTAKFERFARGAGAADRAALRAHLSTFATWFEKRTERNAEYSENGVTVHWGPGRIDGLSNPINETVCKLAELGDAKLRAAIEIPGNCVPGQPAASIPHLWGETKLEFVQWVANVHSSLGRNVGEVDGVFGHSWVEADSQGKPVFRSSADMRASHILEGWLSQLKPPKWKTMAGQGLVPPLDDKLVTRGAAVYEQRCQQCHSINPDLTAPNAAGYRYWKVNMSTVDEVGTDPTQIKAFLTRKATVPALLIDAFKATFGASAVGPDNSVNAQQYTVFTVGAQIRGGFGAAGISGAELLKVTECRDARQQTKMGYRARSLEGVVFTAPYLHNGSIPTLDDLLKPAAERPKKFYLGCPDYDTTRLGFACNERSPRAWRMDTTLPANSNAGHEFGTDLPPGDKAALLEYLKALEEPAAPPLPAGGVCRFESPE
jgi:hypothetical protein